MGVLALSWRLNNDPTTRPPVAQTPLTPGMGFVNDDSDSGAETGIFPPGVDVESATGNGNGSPIEFRTPTSRDNDLLSVTRLHRTVMTESEEIWEELEDDSRTNRSPLAHRLSSARSTPSRFSPSNRVDDSLPPSESTALLARSGTGRSYRGRKRRRSAPFAEGLGLDRRRGLETQEAIGGWWKMKWWDRGDGKGKDIGEDEGERSAHSEGDDVAGQS